MIGLGLAVIGVVMDLITGPLWVHLGLHAYSLEIIGTGLFWLSYIALWILLPVAAFRPVDRFYLHGDCLLRLRKFGLVFGALTVIHVILIATVWYTFRGGFTGGA